MRIWKLRSRSALRARPVAQSCSGRQSVSRQVLCSAAPRVTVGYLGEGINMESFLVEMTYQLGPES